MNNDLRRMKTDTSLCDVNIMTKGKKVWNSD